jgi:aminoglycoside 6'-N-acetyltransferase I
MLNLLIRPATPNDCSALAWMCHLLWPDASAADHARELAPILSGHWSGSLPVIFFLAQHHDGRVVGFIQVGLRSHADGCDPAHPVGFVEGWFVQPEFRRQGIGAQLLAKAERWSREQSCREMASDTGIDNLDSQQVHNALGFEVVDRCVHYRKPL